MLWCTVHAELAVNDDDIEYAAAPTAREHETRRRRSPMSGLVTQDFNLSLYTSPAEFVILIASILANYAADEQILKGCVLKMTSPR